MSKVAIVGDPSGTGTFTISAPNGNTDRTLLLPDEAGTVLTSASGLTAGNLTGSVPASAMPAGSVVQVVSNYSFNSISGAQQTWVNSPVSATITPLSSANKIFVLFDLPNLYTPSSPDFYLRILSNGVAITPQRDDGNRWSNTLNMQSNRQHASIQMLHSPNSTSPQTYSCQGWLNIASASTLYMNYPSDRGIHTVTLMEIAG